MGNEVYLHGRQDQCIENNSTFIKLNDCLYLYICIFFFILYKNHAWYIFYF